MGINPQELTSRASNNLLRRSGSFKTGGKGLHFASKMSSYDALFNVMSHDTSHYPVPKANTGASSILLSAVYIVYLLKVDSEQEGHFLKEFSC